MSSKKNSANDLGLTLGMLLLRIWLGMRAIQTGLEKYAGIKEIEYIPVEIDGAPNEYGLTKTLEVKAYGLSYYEGVPGTLSDKFKAEPLIPDFFLSIYSTILGPSLIILGLTVLLGIATRLSLFAMGLLYTSLTFGLILIKQDAGIAWLGVHIVMVAMALALAKYNRFAVLKKW
jgi:thiosulfate dehydrogenase [quinone] large subunit